MAITSGQGTTTVTLTGTANGTTNNNVAGALKVSSTNSCGNTSAFRTGTVTYCHDGVAMNSSKEEQAAIFSDIYPNPTASDFTIDVTSDVDKDIVVEVYDMLGNLVISKKHQIVSGTNTMKTNIEDFNNGMYFMRLLDSNSNVIHSQTVVKQ